MFEEASWNSAPQLTEGALTLDLDAKRCNLNYWIQGVAQGTWLGLENGHSKGTLTPEYMRRDGPLRDAMIEELAYRSEAEELAARALCYLVIHAPCRDTMEFYMTQALDEARHSSVFRGHLFELGVTEETVDSVIQQYAGDQITSVLKPLESWVLEMVRDQKDFIGGVIIFTILIEGVLAPAAEISERKWRLIDPAAAEIEKGANIDEIRHLTVGASIVKHHLEKHPESKDHIMALIKLGVEKWSSLPTDKIVLQRERLFQQDLHHFKDVLSDYEIAPGLLLIDSTPEQRLDIANALTRELQIGRLEYMGLTEAYEWLL